MPVPDFQQFMLPLLEIAGDGKEHSLSELTWIISARSSGGRVALLGLGA